MISYAIRTSLHFEDWYENGINESKSMSNNDYYFFSEAFKQYCNAVSSGYSVDCEGLHMWLEDNYSFEEIVDMLGSVSCQAGIKLFAIDEEEWKLILTNFREYDYVEKVFVPSNIVDVNPDYIFSTEELSILHELNINIIENEYNKYFNAF